jgi:SAM-dependent methyltransferase
MEYPNSGGEKVKRELLIGCGNAHDKRMVLPGDSSEWENLTTLDHDPDCDPDVLHDLNHTPYPFEDNEFDEIHAYEVLEHLGRQGDYVAFFEQFSELWRILKPGGVLIATVPSLTSAWIWGDPGHTRQISPESLIFLSQKRYEQIGQTAMTDYRTIYKADFDLISAQDNGNNFSFALRAVKGGTE